MKFSKYCYDLGAYLYILVVLNICTLWLFYIFVHSGCVTYMFICLFVWWCLTPFQQYFRYIVAVSFIGGGNRKTRENHRSTCRNISHWQTLSHNVVYTLPWSRFELTTSVVIGTDCIGSCKSNYHTITTTTAPVTYICTL